MKWANTCKLKPIPEARAFMKDLCKFHGLLTEIDIFKFFHAQTVLTKPWIFDPIFDHFNLNFKVNNLRIKPQGSC